MEFKISDILRCKMVSRESEIIHVYKRLVSESERKNSLFKIVRVKDRLNLGTRDIMLNLFFDERILVEVQLGVVDNLDDDKQNYFDKFNHFLY